MHCFDIILFIILFLIIVYLMSTKNNCLSIGSTLSNIINQLLNFKNWFSHNNEQKNAPENFDKMDYIAPIIQPVTTQSIVPIIQPVTTQSIVPIIQPVITQSIVPIIQPSTTNIRNSIPQQNIVTIDRTLNDTVKTNPLNYDDLDVYDASNHMCYQKQSTTNDKLISKYNPSSIKNAEIVSLPKGTRQYLQSFSTGSCAYGNTTEKNIDVMPFDDYYIADHNDHNDFNPADYYKKMFKPIVGELENKKIRGFNYGEFDDLSRIAYIGNIPLKNNELSRPVGNGYVFKDNPGN
jgi:hypothetical protein